MKAAWLVPLISNPQIGMLAGDQLGYVHGFGSTFPYAWIKPFLAPQGAHVHYKHYGFSSVHTLTETRVTFDQMANLENVEPEVRKFDIPIHRFPFGAYKVWVGFGLFEWKRPKQVYVVMFEKGTLINSDTPEAIRIRKPREGDELDQGILA